MTNKEIIFLIVNIQKKKKKQLELVTQSLLEENIHYGTL